MVTDTILSTCEPQTSVGRVATRWLRSSLENGRLESSHRRQANADLIKAGFGGRVHFRRIGDALSKAFNVLNLYGIEPGEVLNAHRHSTPTGSWPIEIAFSNPSDSFSPKAISNSVLYFSWTDLGKSFEVIAYLS